MWEPHGGREAVFGFPAEYSRSGGVFVQCDRKENQAEER